MKLENIDQMKNLIRIRENLISCISAINSGNCTISVELYQPKIGYNKVGESVIFQEDFLPVFKNQLKKVEEEIQKLD